MTKLIVAFRIFANERKNEKENVFVHVSYCINTVKGKGKALPLHRPRQALRVSGSRGSQISRHLAHEDGKVFSPTHRPHSVIICETLDTFFL